MKTRNILKVPPFILSSIALRLMSWIIPISLLGIFLTGLSAYFITKPTILENVKGEVKALSYEASYTISSFFKQRENDLDVISESPLFVDHFNNLEFGLRQEAEAYRMEIERYMLNFAERAGVYKGIWYLDEKGRELASIKFSKIVTQKGTFPEESFLKPYRKSISLNQFTSVPFVDPIFGPMVFYASDFTNKLGERRGTLVLGCSLEPVKEVLNRLRIGSTGRAYLVDLSNNVVDATLGSPIPEDLDRSDLFLSYSDISGTPWKVAVLVDLGNFLMPLKSIRFFTTWISLFCGLSVAFFLYFRIRVLMQPIQNLKKATQRLATGNLSERVPVVSPDEVGTLSRSFNEMAETLQIQRRNLETQIRELNALAIEKASLLENIQRSELRYRTTLDCSIDAIIGLNRSFKITTWNRGAQNLFGYENSKVLGKHITELLPFLPMEKLINEANHRRLVRSYDIEGKTQAGRKVLFNLTLAGSEAGAKGNIEWSLVIRDITEQKALQSQLIQAEKLSVVGQLISGVAHEINNPLAAVVGYAEILATEKEEKYKPLQEDLKFIHQNALRCREIVANLLRFVRKGRLEKKAVDLNEVVQAVLKLMEYRLIRKEAIQVETILAEKLPAVLGDFQQLQQIFVNLIHNACDVLSGKPSPRKITVKTEVKGSNIQVDVLDNGPGIPADLQKKIFEPFFTTKDEVKGTGLGLAISRRIVMDHAGEMLLESMPGKGTRFTIVFPVIKEGTVHKSQEEQVLPAVSGKTILVIEDEKDLTHLMRQLEVEEGNKVEVATNGMDGLEKLKESNFDLVICDVELGDIKGQDVWKSVQKMRRKPPFVFVTGDIINPKLVEEMKYMDVPWIAKPFSLHDFYQTVRKSLGSGKEKKN